MDNIIKAIPVRGAHDDALTLYEHRQVVPYLTALGLPGGAKRLALDTGEEVRRIDNDSFEIVATGERLTRIK